MATKITNQKWLNEEINFDFIGEHVISAFEVNNSGIANTDMVYTISVEKYKDDETNKYNLYCYLNQKFIGCKRKSLDNNPILDNCHTMINCYVMEKMFEELS
tara:strand:+ start:208 stop:513 length:306 start_codon:yes stop_codon:yes gene_type:complete